MSQAILNYVTQSSIKKMPELKAGQTVRVHQRIKEGEKERTQIFEGLVIRINSGHGVAKTFTVRKLVEGVGVEKIFPMYSPNIQKIQIVKEGKVRSAKLYYMRDLSGKSTRLRELLVAGMGGEAKLEKKDSKQEEIVKDKVEEIKPDLEEAVKEEKVEESNTPLENKEE